jgi:hypothetical protein
LHSELRKKFHACENVGDACNENKKSMRAVDIFLAGGLAARAARCKKSLFHRMLCDVGAMRPRCAA